jgi:hypothetical protein
VTHETNRIDAEVRALRVACAAQKILLDSYGATLQNLLQRVALLEGQVKANTKSIDSLLW